MITKSNHSSEKMHLFEKSIMSLEAVAEFSVSVQRQIISKVNSECKDSQPARNVTSYQ